MPELPDVEVFKRHLDSTALHKKIQRAEVRCEELLHVTPRTLKRRLHGHALESTRRHGKFLFAGTGKGKGALMLHFGMTGSLEYGKDKDKPPEHSCLALHFGNGYRLDFINVRKFGEMDWVNDVDDYLKERDLGPDAADLMQDEFIERLSEKRGSIKSALMDQSTMAGIGNVYSDEILFQAGIHPKTSTKALEKTDLLKIYKKMHRVFEDAIAAKAQPGKMPGSFLTPRREPGKACPKCGGKLEKTKVNGRSTYLCPTCQEKR